MIWGCKLPDPGLCITSICVPVWTSPAAHWLLSTAGGAGSIPGWGTKILHAVRCGQKKKTKRCVPGCLLFHGQRSLARYRPWGHKELDAAERLTLSLLGFPHGSEGKESACNAGDLGLILGLGIPGNGNGCPLRYSCLEDSMDRGAWWAVVHGVTKGQTHLSNLRFHDCLFLPSFSPVILFKRRVFYGSVAWVHFHQPHPPKAHSVGMSSCGFPPPPCFLAPLSVPESPSISPVCKWSIRDPS